MDYRAIICVLHGTTQYELQSNLRWLLLVLGSDLPEGGRSVNQGQLPRVPGLGPLSKRYRVGRNQMLLVWEILGKSATWAKSVLCMEKLLATVWVGHQDELGRVLGITRAGQRVLVRLGDSDMVSACGISEGRAQQRSNGLCQHICLGESCPSSPCPETRQFSSYPNILALFELLI